MVKFGSGWHQNELSEYTGRDVKGRMVNYGSRKFKNETRSVKHKHDNKVNKYMSHE